MPSVERDAETTLSKANKAEFARNYDQAFKLYIETARLFLHLTRSTAAEERTKQKWKASAERAVSRAEMIKKFVESKGAKANPGQAPDKSTQLTPVAIDHFSAEEQLYVLKKGATVNGLSFPLWDEAVKVQLTCSAPYSDPDGQPKLSPEQENASPVWRRATLKRAESFRSQRPVLPQEILQRIVTDCSVCASVSVCLEHIRRFGSQLEYLMEPFSSPQSPDDQRTNGRYDVRIMFNGAWRRIVIDDYLPYNPIDNTLIGMSVLQTEEGTCGEIVWPSLLEKAYMKLMGGYDFPGSNSSIDLYALTGWIPEHIEINRSAFEREKTWDRVEKGFSSGRCLVTLGTGPADHIRWRDIPLLPSHSYAVINAYENEEGRMFTVIDSWIRAYDSKDKPLKLLEIPWSEILNIFEGIYLSWDPRLWQQPLTFHGMWKRNNSDDDDSRQLQVEFRTDTEVDGEIWVLLTRHVVNTHKNSDFIALQVDIVDEVCHASASLESQHSLSSKGTYTNSTHILSRVRIPKSQRSGVLSISASYDGDATEIGFTLTIYAEERVKILWLKNKPNPPFLNKKEGTFTSMTAGGNCSYPSFMINPQYRLTLHSSKAASGNNKANIAIMLHTNKDIPVNASLTWSHGQRVTELSTKNLIASSGAYTYGLARVTASVSPGEYTIIVSAFEPQHMGPYSLKVESSQPFDLVSIPKEDSAKYSKIVRGVWEGESAAGAPSFEKYTKNPIYLLDVPSKSQLIIRLQLLQPSTVIPLNVTVYPVLQNLELSLDQKRHVATSGAYDSGLAGVVTPQLTIPVGKYYIVPSTYSPATEAGFRILIYCTTASIKVKPLDRKSIG